MKTNFKFGEINRFNEAIGYNTERVEVKSVF